MDAIDNKISKEKVEEFFDKYFQGWEKIEETNENGDSRSLSTSDSSNFKAEYTIDGSFKTLLFKVEGDSNYIDVENLHRALHIDTFIKKGKFTKKDFLNFFQPKK